MSLPVNLTDGSGSKAMVKVTARGELVVAPVSYSSSYFQELANINTAYNFITPKSGYEVVITSIIVNANKGVSSTDGALIELFTANSPTSTTAITDILTVQLVKNTRQALTGLNLIMGSGVWLNAVTDDNTVFLTVAGFYIKEISG